MELESNRGLRIERRFLQPIWRSHSSFSDYTSSTSSVSHPYLLQQHLFRRRVTAELVLEGSRRRKHPLTETATETAKSFLHQFLLHPRLGSKFEPSLSSCFAFVSCSLGLTWIRTHWGLLNPQWELLREEEVVSGRRTMGFRKLAR